MSGRARPRLTLKLAWRQLLRTKGSSLLVAALIAVPVAGASGVLTFVESRKPTPEQAVTLELGKTQSWISIVGPPDPTRRQAVDYPVLTSYGEPQDAEGRIPTDLTDAALPAGTQAIAITQDSARMTTRNGVAGFPVIYGESWDPRLGGRFEVISGEHPAAADEGMASPDLLQRLGARVGDEIELPEQQRSIHIVGVMRALDASEGTQTLFLPSTAGPEQIAAEPHTTRWFLPDWQPDAAQLADLNHAGYIAYSRDLVLDPPPGADTRATMMSDQSVWMEYLLVTLGTVFGGLLVGLLAAAAMAVSARRQQRSLAVVTTVGARGADVFRLVLTQGGLLGLAGGVIGSALAIGAVAVIFAVLDPGVENLMFSSWGLRVPWTVALVVAFAVLVGLAASALPARAATHGDALAALRGARRPVRMSRRQPVWGFVILVVGALTVGAAGALFAFNGAQRIWYDGLQTAALWTAIIGVLLLLLGVTVTGQGILAALARVLAHGSAGARLASRDAFANSPRTVPAFVSIAASAATATFVLCAVALTGAQSVRNYAWAGPEGSVVVTNWGESADSAPPAFLADAGAERIIPVGVSPEPTMSEDGTMTGPASGIVQLGYQDPRSEGGWIASPGTGVKVVAPDDVEQLTGIRFSAQQRKAFEQGGAIAILGTREVPEGNLTHVSADDTVRLDYWDAAAYTADAPEPLRSVEIPVDVHLNAASAYPVVLSPAAAAKYGVVTETRTWVSVFDEPPSSAVMDRLRADAETASVAGAQWDVMPENGPGSPLPWLALVLGILSVIVISAAAISLGLARIERQEDDATLAAVGATVGLRREVSAWQAMIIVGVGCVTGTCLGVVGAWVLTQASANLLLTDLPFPWLAGTAFGLPLAIALVSLLIRPPRADLTRRTAIA